MNIDQLLAVIDELPPEDLERVKAHLAEGSHKPRPKTAEEWEQELKSIAEEFRGESSDEEMREIIEAMNLKSKPSDKGL